MIPSQIQQRIYAMESLIGKTPLLEIHFKYKGVLRKIFAKAEHYNLTGSIKDRMALHVIRKSYEEGSLKPGQVIAEATSGNTGIAFSAIGSALGHEVVIFMPNWMSIERQNLIKSYGATVVPVSAEEGGFLGSIAMTEKMAAENPNIFLPKQFANIYNTEAHYLQTGPEIQIQLGNLGLKPDAVVAGVGTGGTIMGLAKYFNEVNPQIKVHPMEPANSPTLRTGHKVGKHRIQGISDDFIPEIVKLNSLDEVIDVDDGDAIIMAQRLAKVLGLGVGISSGANFIAALKAQLALGKDAVVVTIFADDNKKYLSTDLLKQEAVKEDHLSKDIELVNVMAYTGCQL